MNQPTRIFDLLQILEERHPDKDDILNYRNHHQWVKYSVAEYRRISTNIAYGLLAKGYRKENKMIVISSNRPECNFLEMGATMAGLIFISLYPTLSEEDLLYIFNNSEADILVFGSKSLYKKISPVADKADKKIDCYIIDSTGMEENSLPSIWEIEKSGEENKSLYEAIIADNIKNIDKDEVATLLYTSGTTGTPKGVMLTHWNLMFNSHAHSQCMPIDHHSKMMSFLPLAHIYERSMNYNYQELGIGIYYSESLSTIVRDMAECHADGFCAVPRVLEKIYSELERYGKQLHSVKKFIYQKAWNFAIKHDYYKKGWLYDKKLKLYDKLVYSHWREKLGGKKLTIVSGGSALQQKILRLFCAAGMTIHEGYGLSETSPVIAVNNPMIGVNVFGTVGKPLKGTELKIAEDGEIMTKGPHVMKGYYKLPELTKEVIDEDGWFHTGDIGYLVDGQFLKITDRKKEIFKTTAGKYIAPQMIESKISENVYFTNSIVFGAGQKYASAIITIDKVKLIELAKSKGIKNTDCQELISNDDILAILNSQIKSINQTLAPYEQIKRHRYTLDCWTTENGLISQTLKIKRNAIMNRYSSVIESIYR